MRPLTFTGMLHLVRRSSKERRNAGIEGNCDTRQFRNCTNHILDEEDTRACDATSHRSTMRSLTSYNMLHLMDDAFRLNSRDARNTERIATITVSKICTNRKINEEDTRVWDATSHGSTMQSLTSNNMLHSVSFPKGKRNVSNISQCQKIARIAKRTKRTRGLQRCTSREYDVATSSMLQLVSVSA
jgi:hypothetical protein